MYRFVLIFVDLIFVNFLFAQPTKYPFQNPSLPLEERVTDLVSRMTLDEKIAQMGDGLRSGDISPLPVSGKNYESTCVYCDYQSVCLHEDSDPDRPILYIPDEELYQKLTEEADGNEQAGNSLDR